MPRLRRAAKHRRAGYGPGEVRHLLYGHGWFSRLSHGAADDSQALREAWETLRGKLLPAWVAEHPATRPYAWWLFDAPERRRRVDGKPHPFDCPERNRRVKQWRTEHPAIADDETYRLHYGMPSCLMTADDFDAEYEPEADYLARLGLLSSEERPKEIRPEPPSEQNPSPITTR